MKFNEIPAQVETVQIRLNGTPSLKLKEGASVTQVHFNGETDLLYEGFPVRPVDELEKRRLDSILASGPSHLFEVRNISADGLHAELAIATFPCGIPNVGDMEVAYGDAIKKFFSDHRVDEGKVRNLGLSAYLKEHFTLEWGGESYFFMVVGPAMESVLDELKMDEEPLDEMEGKKSFCLCGDMFRFVASESAVRPGSYGCSKFTLLHNKEDKAIRLVHGSLKFVESSQAKELGLFAAQQLQHLMSDNNSYLSKWDEYGTVEGEILLKKARDFNFVSYTRIRDKSDCVKIKTISNSARDLLSEGKVESLVFVNELPEYLVNSKMTFEEYSDLIIHHDRESAQQKKEKSKAQTYEVKKFDSENMTLYFEEDLELDEDADSGMLCLSLDGEITQVKRRIVARELIRQGRSANPQLGLILDRSGQVTFTQDSRNLLALSPFVREKLKRSLTPAQEKAIQVALNTPDIAVIQGPPGTGKTTVITAIMERLNEEHLTQYGSNGKGCVLLTSFQHDAVENMVDRMTLNSLPVPKFGRKHGQEGFNAFERNMHDWCEKLAKSIREKNPQVSEVQNEKMVKELCEQYLNAPSFEFGVQLLHKMQELGCLILGEELFNRISMLLSRSRDEHDDDNASVLAKIRGLRTREESFRDDGAERAEELLDELDESLEKSKREILEKAASWKDSLSLDFLPSLARLKVELLQRNTEPPVFVVDKPNTEIVEVMTDVLQRIREKGRSAKDSKMAALAEFLSDLECNPDEMVETVMDYSFAFAATCQQSMDKNLLRQKGIDVNSNQGKPLEYQYVIIDEAARVNPRDLLIPMSQGVKIILVGDHRQLPHIIDVDVAEAMEEGRELKESEQDWIKKSMFEYLFSERIAQLEKDDPSHLRHVTLDTQYRMHPVLGDFVSRNFYERFDSNEKFGSGLPAEFYAHQLARTNGKPAVWMDVPLAKGCHNRKGTSYVRKAEVDAIVRQLTEWISSEEGKDLTYGVISFYKAQADEIWNRIKKYEWSRNVRVGTVDSFQGMEFDVVFLSAVRTIFDMEKAAVPSQKNAQSLFGHLCLYNRLNVSMSRQKKLLVVVGDSQLVHNECAKEFVPGLVDFYHLCETAGEVIYVD